MPRRTTLAVLTRTLLAISCGLAGCMEPETTPAISMHEEKPLKSELGIAAARLVNQRYVLIPTTFVRPKPAFESPFYAGSLSISGSAWSGGGFGSNSGGHSDDWVNLTVVDTTAGGAHSVFDRQVALRGWSQSLDPNDGTRLRFPDQLLLDARANDTNKDGRIDAHDRAALYIYHIENATLAPVSPPEQHLERLEIVGDRLIMLLTDQPDGNVAAVYAYDMATQRSTCAAADLKP